MAEQAASLTSFTLELVKGLEEMQVKREELDRKIAEEEAEKVKIERDLEVLQRRLQQITANLAKKTTTRSQYDKVIAQTEEALGKIVESSHALVAVTKKSQADIAKLAGQLG